MSVLTFRFFGTGQLQNVAGETISIRSRKQLALLAYLLMESGHAHSRDSLMALLWADHGIDTARNNLRVTLSNLRKLTAIPASADSESIIPLILSNQFDVQVNPEASYWFDVAEFGQRLQQTRIHLHTNNANTGRSECAECQPLLEEVASFYQNELLSGLSLDDCPEFEEWLFMQRERQHLLALEAYADLATFAESTGNIDGDFDQAARFVRRQIELDPLREFAYRQQMRILAKQGERSQALAAFDRCHAVINEELGVDPEPETLALREQILSQEIGKQEPRTSTNGSEQQSPKPSGSDAAVLGEPDSCDENPNALPNHNLPVHATPFFGRERELTEINQNLTNPTCRLLTIFGAGGTGKTRLALEVGRHQLEAKGAQWDGLFFVSLSGVDSIENIASTIASALKLSLSGRQSTLEQLIEHLRPRRVCLILDNFEQLMDGVDILQELLSNAADLQLVVTSRERLNLSSEDVVSLRGLDFPHTTCPLDEASRYAAIRLFVERAYRRRKQFRLDGEIWPHVCQICQLLEGLPLGIELATTWIDTLSCAEIADSIATDMSILETDMRDIPPHHRSLHLVFQRSWDQLSTQDQKALAALSVMRGTFRTADAVAIGETTPITLRRLHNKSLLDSDEAGTHSMHTLLRQFSSQILHTDSGAAAAAQNAHATYFVSLVEQHVSTLTGNEPNVALQTLGQAYENILASWHWVIAQPDAALLGRMLEGIARYHDAKCLYTDGRDLMQHAIDTLPAHFEREEPGIFGQLLMHLGSLVCNVDYLNVIEIEERAIACASEAEAWDVVAEAYHSIGRVQLHQFGDYERARNSMELGIDYAKRGENLTLLGDLERNLGNTYRQQGDYDSFLNHVERALDSYRKSGSLWRQQLALNWLGYYSAQATRLGKSKLYNDEAFAMNAHVGDPAVQAGVFISQAMWGSHFGYYEDALQLLRDALDELEQHQSSWQICHTLTEIGRIYSKRQKHSEAIEFEKRALAIAEENGLAELKAYALTGLGYVYAEANQLPQAKDAYIDALASWQAIGREQTLVEVQVALANIAMRQGRLTDAQELVTAIVPAVLTMPLHASFEPLLIYWHCYQVLHTSDMKAAEQVLARAKERLDQMVDSLDDSTLREDLLTGVELHRLISADTTKLSTHL